MFAQRDNQRRVIGLYAIKQPGIAEEEVPDTTELFDFNTSLDTLNRTLSQKGTVTRGLAVLMFKEINKLRVKNGDPAYTLAQFTTALQAEMDG